jgi:fused signal recognition particle receptor
MARPRAACWPPLPAGAIEQGRVVPVYFIGIGEKLEDLQTFNAREFAQALLD